MCMDDEIDIEAEKVYCDIKNLQEEKTFHYYYKKSQDEFLLTQKAQMKEEELERNRDLERTIKSTKININKSKK